MDSTPAAALADADAPARAPLALPGRPPPESTRSSTSTTWRLRAAANGSLVASSPIAASIVSLCSIGKKHSATVVISSCSGSTDGPGAGDEGAHEAGESSRHGDRMAGTGREMASAVERFASHQANERGALAEEVDVAVDQQLERRTQLAGPLELVGSPRRERLEASLALGEQALEHRCVEALLATEEVGRQRRRDAGASADLAEARAVVAALRKELLRGVEDRPARGLGVAAADIAGPGAAVLTRRQRSGSS